MSKSPLQPVTTEQRPLIGAEQSVIGALLIPDASRQRWSEVAETGIQSACFVSVDLAIVFEHMKKVASAGQAVDVTTVADSLSAAGELDRIGGYGRLAELASNTPSTANVITYARACIDAARDRRLQSLASADQPFADKVASIEQYLLDSDGAGNSLSSVDLSSLMTAEITTPGFVFKPITPRGVATLLGGHGGIGKSMLGLTLCAHAAAGVEWAGFRVERCRALFVSLEDGGELVRYRLKSIIKAYDLDADIVAVNLQIIDGSSRDAALMVEGVEFPHRMQRTRTMSLLCKEAAGAGLIVIDNASDAFDGNENSRRDVRAFMRALTALARDNNAAVILLAHIDKVAARAGGAGNSYSGSTAWHNSARSRLAMIEKEGSIELLHEKANLSQRADPVPLVIGEHGVVIPARSRPNLSGLGNESQASADADAILQVVELAITAGIIITTATTGPCTAWHALEHLPELAGVYRDKDGKRRVSAALLRLQREGRLKKVSYQKANRHAGERWELAQNSVTEVVDGL